MAGGVELANVFGSGATVHGSMNREHREREREQGISARPIRRPEDVAEAAVAMADGRELLGARERGLWATKHASNSMGRKRGAQQSSPRRNSETEATRGRRATRRADDGSRRCCGGCCFLMHGQT